MSRWIDADALHDALKAKQMWVVRYGDKHNEGYTYDQVHFAIDEAPSIDIVRCSECVYCNVQNTKYLYAICERHGIEFKPFEDDTRTHGCAWGKQTEGADDDR